MLKALPSTLLVALPLAVAYAQTNVPPPALPDAVAGAAAPRSAEYAKLQARLQHGWDTWDTTTIAGEVLLPEGLKVSIGLKNNHAQADDSVLSTRPLLRKKGSGQCAGEKPGPHSYHGT